MNKAMITFVLCCCMISCIKDEAPNNECDIESAWVEGAELEKLFYKPADMRQREHQFYRDEHHICCALDRNDADRNPSELQYYL